MEIDKNFKFKILLLSTILILPRWLISYYYFLDEDINLRIINEINDITYLPLIHSVSNFVLNPIYSEVIQNNNLFFSFPALNFAIISFFYKILGGFAFVFIEIISVFLFIYIFYKIFIYFHFKSFPSLLFSIILLFSPLILNYLSLFNYEVVELINTNYASFYSLRFPRPVVTNILLFGFLLLSFKIYYKGGFNYKFFLFLGFLSALTLHSFYYFFIFQNVLLFLICLTKYKKLLYKHFIVNLRLYFFYTLPLLISILIFIININYADPEYAVRLGIVDIDISKRVILLKYFLDFITNKSFLFLFITNLLIYFYIKDNNNFFLLFFISTILSTLIFILFSGSVVDVYHFYNWIIISGLLSLLISLFFQINQIFFKHKIKLSNFSIIILLAFITIFSNIPNFIKYQDFDFNKRNNHNKLINFIKKNKINFQDKEILTLDSETFIWLVLNDHDNFTYIPECIWTVRSIDQLEKDLISVFHFFKLNRGDFYSYLKNKNENFRMYNINLLKFLGRKYTANKLYTFNNSIDFDQIDFIKKIKPTISHSVAIPNFEMDRLLKRYDAQKDKILPKIIIFNSSEDILFQNNGYLLNNYCNIFSNDHYKVLSLLSVEKSKC